ncbi:MAG: hypothetical protein IRY91_04245 [Gemmatimonadaceae bacterium]|nr:hypothetical protein [Gemmatimonadaceae bacterium]
MTKTVQVVYDGSVLRPEEPDALKGLPINVPFEITLEGPRLEPGESLRLLASLDLDEPADSAEHLDEYLEAIRRESER